MLFRFLRTITIYIAMVLVTGVVTPSYALEPSTPLGRLARQAWTMENGLPQNTVPVLLQSHDGFLWAGTELGLVRFDGVSFRILDHATTASFPDAEIRCLLDAGGESGLWIGTGDGLVRWKNGSATLLTTRDGLPGNSIRGIAQTSDGTLWVWTESGLARLIGQQFQTVASENGLPGSGITSIAADAAGGLWVGTMRGTAVFRGGHWQPGPGPDEGSDGRPGLVKATASGEVLIANTNGVFLDHAGPLTMAVGKTALPLDEISFLDQFSDGTVAVASKSSIVLAPHGASANHGTGPFVVSKELPGSRIESIYADREQSLWVGTNRGLVRVRMGAVGPVVQLFPPFDPLASNSILSLLEDREGDLWVGTETNGLHILRDSRFRTLGTTEGLSSDNITAIVEDSRKVLWIGSRDAGLNRVSTVQNTTITTANGLLSNVILSLAAAPDGTVWVGTPDGLNEMGTGEIVSYTSAEGLPDDFIRSLLVAPDGSVWIGTRRGLTHLDHGRFQTLTQADGLGSDLVGTLAHTPDGDLWIATLNGLSRLHRGRLKNYTTADGLSSNVITALDVAADGKIWVGTQNDGLNLWNGKRFVPVRRNSTDGGVGLLPAAIHAIVHDNRGHLWLASSLGLTRVDLKALIDCAEQGACSLNPTHVANFTMADGLRSREMSSNSHPTAYRASDGKLLFSTPRGVIVVDPLHFPASPPAPPVVIERFAVDDRDMLVNDRTRIAAGALRFQFDYAGLSFAAPQKLRYQYMLEGFDHVWIDAGMRRTAYYTNIPPGDYRFCVRAALGEDAFTASTARCEKMPSLLTSVGYSGPPQADMSFELLPRYYQTMWFRTLLILTIVALIFGIFRRRVLRVEREFGAVMAERSRIAREIHDTLAQGYVGISLQLEILGELLRHNRSDAAQKHLAMTQDLVREGLDDARQSIWALRSQDSGEQTLPIRLRRLVEQAEDSKLTASLAVHGAYRALVAETEKEILRIAQEAIHNVKRHAEASQLRVRLDYDELGLTLTITDDGRGFAVNDSTLLTSGHYGLTGMRERAALIGAEIRISSTPGNGTAVSLHVPVADAAPKTVAANDGDTKYSDRNKEQV